MSAPSALSIVAGTLAAVFQERANRMREHSAPPRYRHSVYYIGPDSLARDCRKRRLEVRFLFENLGIACWWPIEWELFTSQNAAERETDIPGMMYNAILNSVRDADALVANITPFRGPHMYVLTAFAIGIATALGKPIFGWSESSMLGAPNKSRVRWWRLKALKDRIRHCGAIRPSGQWRDAEGYGVENFDLPDCAPLVVAIEPVYASIEAVAAECAAYLERRRSALP